MVSRLAMRGAHLELATRGVLAYSFLVMVILMGPFTIWDSLNLRPTLSLTQHVGGSAAFGVFALLICYAGGFLALYAAQMRPWYQAMLALAGMELILAVPVAANVYAAYAIVHGGRTPDIGVLGLYVTIAAHTLAGAAATLPVLMLRVSRGRLLATGANEKSRSPDAAPWRDHATDLGTCSEGSAATSVGPRRRSAIPAGMVDASGRREADSQPDDRDESCELKPAQAHTAASKPLQDRLDGTLDDIVYLRVSGHYLEVVTESASMVFLKRLSDAVAELGDRGMQTHRSYWVAYRYVSRLRRRDHSMVLRLANNHEIPVSRSFLPAVRDFTSRRERARAGSAIEQPTPREQGWQNRDDGVRGGA